MVPFRRQSKLKQSAGRNDIFVHISAVERAGISALKDGQSVTFEVETGRDGREAARDLALA